MDQQLSTLFTQLTGIKPSKEISLIYVEENSFKYTRDNISSFTSQLYIKHNWDPIIIMWKSNSGKVYGVEQDDIDCNDIVFWFHDLDVPLIHKQVYGNGVLPFKLQNLTYELRVENFSINCQIELLLKKDAMEIAETQIVSIDRFIDNYNEKSERHGRKDGVVHNWTRDISDNILTYELDLGSTGAGFMKKLLKYFSSMKCFEQVYIS